MWMVVQELGAAPNWAEKTTAIATIVLAGAAILALLGLKDARKTRHAQLVTDLSRRWDDRYTREAVTLARQYGSSGTLKLVDALWAPGVSARDPRDLRDWLKMSTYPNLVETLGVYMAEGLISEEVVYKLWGGNILDAWQAWANPIFRLRDLTKTREVWEYFEYANRRMTELLERERAGRGLLRPPDGG